MEYIKANGVEYATKSITTGTDSITFTMEGQEIERVHTAFRNVTELTVSGEDKVTYGIYGNLYFSSATVHADATVTVTMRMKSDTEIRLENIEASQDIQDEAIVELAGIIAGGE